MKVTMCASTKILTLLTIVTPDEFLAFCFLMNIPALRLMRWMRVECSWDFMHWCYWLLISSFNIASVSESRILWAIVNEHKMERFYQHALWGQTTQKMLNWKVWLPISHPLKERVTSAINLSSSYFDHCFPWLWRIHWFWWLMDGITNGVEITLLLTLFEGVTQMVESSMEGGCQVEIHDHWGLSWSIY